MVRPVPRFPLQTTTPYRKSVLFCSECEHESLTNGDWIVKDLADTPGKAYDCPECGNRVIVQSEYRQGDDPTRRQSSGGPTGVGMWSHVWVSYAKFVSEWLPPQHVNDDESIS